MTIFIQNVTARQIIDSRAIPTIEAQVTLSNGLTATASSPSGASKGRFEALELRDNNPDYLFSKSVLKAVDNVNQIIAPALYNKNPYEQREIDEILLDLDGSDNFSNLGANAVLAVSEAIVCASSKAQNMELFQYIGGKSACILPIPFINIINGGVHAANNLDFQEFMIVPAGAHSFQNAMKIALEVFHKLKQILEKHKFSTNVGDEGGFAPELSQTTEAIELIIDAIYEAKYTTDDVKLALDAASSELYFDKKYHLKGENKVLTSAEMIDYIEKLCYKYPIISIEDALAQDDYEGWINFTARLKDKIMIVGDDLFCTNSTLLRRGIEQNIANSILIKPNQIGTISKVFECVDLAKRNCYKNIISHRSAETESTFIADLAVGLNSGFIKTGSLTRSERVAKYNRLLYIEQFLGKNAKYLGKNAF